MPNALVWRYWRYLLCRDSVKARLSIRILWLRLGFKGLVGFATVARELVPVHTPLYTPVRTHPQTWTRPSLCSSHSVAFFRALACPSFCGLSTVSVPCSFTFFPCADVFLPLQSSMVCTLACPLSFHALPLLARSLVAMYPFLCGLQR